MGRNNNNAGMHFIRYSHYGLDDNLKYYDEQAIKEFQRRKSLESVVNQMAGKEANNADEVIHSVEKQNMVTSNMEVSNVSKDKNNANDEKKDILLEEAQEACYDLFVKTYIHCVHEGYNLFEAQIHAIEALMTYEGASDYDYLFLNYCLRYLGSNIRRVLIQDEKDVLQIIQKDIIPCLTPDAIMHKTENSIQYNIHLADRSKVDATRKYWLEFRDAVKSNKVDFLPEIYSSYEVTIYRDEEWGYVVTLCPRGIIGNRKKSLLNRIKEIEIYREYAGDVANLFMRDVNL